MWNKKILLSIIVVAVLGFFLFISNRDQQELSLEYVQESNNLAKSWLFNNLQENGLFLYSYNTKTKEVSRGNHTIRQLMGSRILAEESSGDDTLLRMHHKNLDYIFSFWYQENDKEGYILYNSKSKLGANAMMLRTLVVSPFFDGYRDRAEKLASGIISLQKEDGSFIPWYIEPKYTYDSDYLLTFYSGEAILSLVEYFEKTKDEVYLNASLLSADFYIHHYIDNMDENYFPAYVPWHTLALNKLYKITGDKKYADAIFTLNDKLLEIQDSIFFVGQFFDIKTPQYGLPHTASDAVYTEGLAYAYEIARNVGDKEHEEKYYEALKIGVANLIRLQYQDVLKDENKSDSVKYIGAIAINVFSNWIRVDTAQHTIDAFTKIETLLEENSSL